MHGRDKAAPPLKLGECSLQRLRRHQPAERVHIGQDHIGAAIPRRVGGRDKGDRRHNRALARFQAQSVISEMQPRGRRMAAERIWRLNRLGKGRLKGGNGRPGGQIVRLQTGLDRGDVRVINPLTPVRYKAIAHTSAP